MKLTIIEPGDVPAALVGAHGTYPQMFQRLFAGQPWDYEIVRVFRGEALPDPASRAAVLITGSAAGVYDDLPWIAPLRAFVRAAFAARTPLVGICFGHQIIADALGGDVRKSDKGWGMGRHRYSIAKRPDILATAPETLAIACSHQDQVILPPADAEVILASEFTPNAGLLYRNGAALTFQPHPEFSDDYAAALAASRRGRAPDAVIDAALASFSEPSDSALVAQAVVAFLAR